MKKLLYFIIFINGISFSQTIINTYPFPQYNHYNYFWGVTQRSDTFWITTTYSTSTSVNQRIYKVTKSGTIVDSIQSPLYSYPGIEWDGNYFWLSQRTNSQGEKLFRMSSEGVIIDSMLVPRIQGQLVTGIGDLAIDGNKLWYSVYAPDFAAYPNGWAFAIDINTKQLVDSIPLRGRQVMGIAVKGDTIFYANDNQYTGETERIYAYSKTTGDTIFSFPAPDPDGTCNPKSLYWDGNYLFLLAERVGPSTWTYMSLYQYIITGAGNPIISVNPVQLDFGNVIIGQQASLDLSVSNIGTGNLLMTNFEYTNTVFSGGPLTYPDTITPGNTKTYSIKFTPSQFDSAFGNLRIYSNDGVTPVKTVPLKGKGIYNGSFINVSSNNYNFGLRRINSKSGWLLTTANYGNSNLVISSAAFTGNIFQFDTTNVSFPVTIPPQGERNFRIWFNPSSAGLYSDSLLIQSNALNSPQLYIKLSGTGETRQYSTGEFLWADNVPFNPYSYTNDMQPSSMKKLPDVNNDGVDEVVVASKNYLVTCFNGNSSVTGDVLWSFNSGYNNNNTGSVMYENSLQVRTDVDGDGKSDVVFGCGGGNEMVYTVSGRTGQLIWAYGDSINWEDGDINGLRADKDFNNDGVNDVLISASGSSSGGRHAAICLNGINGNVIFNLVQSASYTFDVTTMQNGGIIVVDLSNGGPYYLNGFTTLGLSTWTVPVPDVVWNLREINDINNDGLKDFVGFAGGMNVNVFARDAALGTIIWNMPYPNYATFADIRIISDVNQNGYSDMIFSGKEGVFRHDTKTGALIWGNPLDNSYVFGIDEMGDLNSDGINEIAASTKNSNVYIINGLNGQVIYQHTFGAPISQAAERVINAGNVDQNYSTDFTAGSKDGRIVCFSGGLAGPVPAELISFSAEVLKNEILLNWKTATEKNNSGFRIMLNDSEAGFVEGNGTTSEMHEYTFRIRNAENGFHKIKLVQVDYDGTESVSAEKEVEISSVPREFMLYQNYPNPFNPSTVIEFDVPQNSHVEIKVYDLLGNETAVLVNKEFSSGSYEVNFDAKGLAAGVYFYSVKASKDGTILYSSNRKMLLIK